MKKLKIIMLALTIGVIGSIVSSCSSGVDRSDPRAVAEKAVEYYLNNDFEQLKTLVDPDDTFRLEDLDKWSKWVEDLKAKDPDYKPTKTGFTFIKISDKLTGGEFSPATTLARVDFETERGYLVVILQLSDGKWYYERMN